MSFADPESDVVQPEEGQGDGGTSDAPYAEYLNRIPEEVRGDIEPVFKDWDANVTKRFQDASEFRKQWEPLQDTGVNQLSKDEVAWLVQFRQALDDPQTMQQWWEGYARENGLTPAQAQEIQQQQESPTLDEFGYQDPSQQFEKLLEEKLSPLSQQVEQVLGWRQQQEQQAAEAEALRFIEGQVGELETKHGELTADTKELLNTLAGRYIESDPMNAIPRAYEDLQRWRNDVEKSALQAKVDAPAPAETGGVPDVTPEKITTFKQAEQIGAEILRNFHRS